MKRSKVISKVLKTFTGRSFIMDFLKMSIVGGLRKLLRSDYQQEYVDMRNVH